MPRIPGAERLTPPEILRLEPEEADSLLERLEAAVPSHRGLVRLPRGSAREAIVFGDSHGDWRSTLAVTDEFLESSTDQLLVGLGDYVDRAPSDCAEGSVANSLWLLQLAAEFPDRVLLLQGNHETARRIPLAQSDLAEEVDGLWGPVVERFARLVGLLERGPFAALTESGAYFAHAGFPRLPEEGPIDPAFDARSEEALLDLVWAGCSVSRHPHLGTPQFTENDFSRFSERSGARVFLRGHDPDLTGRPVFHDRVLTLHTSRLYERFGGVIFARVPIAEDLRGLGDLRVEPTGTAGHIYPEP